MAVLVVYDISDNNTRAKIAGKLEMMGYTRIQRSVWVKPYGYTDEALRAYRKLVKYRLGGSDRIHIFIIPKWSYEKAISIGPQPPKPELREVKIF